MPKVLEYKDFSDEAIEKFKDSIQRFNWSHVTDTDCAQTAYNNFSTTFSHFYQTYFPTLQKKFDKNFHSIEPWMTRGLLISRRQKILLGRLHLKNRNDLNLQRFKDYRNLYNKTVRTAKKLFYEKKLASNQANIKKVWQILYSAVNIKRTKSSNVKDLFINNQLVSDPLQIANFLNVYFTNVASSIVADIEPTDRPPDGQIQFNENTFCFTTNPITFSEIKEACDQLESKRSPDFEGISLFLSKKLLMPLLPQYYMSSVSTCVRGLSPHNLKLLKWYPFSKVAIRQFLIIIDLFHY